MSPPTARPQRPPRQPWTIARRITVLALVPAALVLALGAGVLRQQMHAALYGSFAQTLQDKHQRVAARLRWTSRHTVIEPVGSTDEFSTIYSGWYWQASAPGLAQTAQPTDSAADAEPALPSDATAAGLPASGPSELAVSNAIAQNSGSSSSIPQTESPAAIHPASAAERPSAPLAEAKQASSDAGGQAQLGVSRSLWDAPPLTARAAGPHALHLLAATGPMQEPLLGWSAPASIYPPTHPLGNTSNNAQLSSSATSPPITLTVFGPATALQASLQRIDHILLASFLALLLLLAALLAVQLRLGLLPLRRFARAVAEQRMQAAAPPDPGAQGLQDLPVGADLAPLQQELRSLLQHNAQVVSRARAHAADLNHALKKPLALLTASASRGAAVASDEVLAHAQAMGQLIDRYQARSMSDARHARASAGPVLVLPVLQGVLSAMRKLHAAQDLAWQLGAPRASDGRLNVKPDELRWRGDTTDLEEALGNLLDNAGKWAASQVRVSLNEVADNSDSNAPSRSLHIHVEDDGPGMSAAQLASAGQRGLRCDESVSGTGLGLAIARQIALAYGGELRLAKSYALKGLRATLVLKL